jgi:hypothetical protein
MVVSTQPGEAYADPSGSLLWVLLEPLGRDDHTMCVVMWAEDDQSRYLVVHATAEEGRYGLQFEDGDRASRWEPPGTLGFEQAFDGSTTPDHRKNGSLMWTFRGVPTLHEGCSRVRDAAGRP